MKMNSRLVLFTVILVAIAIACKLLFAARIGWSGVSPIMAIALFSGMLINDKTKSFFLPLIALFAADLVIEVLYLSDLFVFPGLYKNQFLNYSIVLLTTLLGWALKGKNYGSLITGAIAAPTLFFLVSNFNVWVSNIHGTYSKDFAGLMNCYEAGLPFYRNALGATLVFLPAIVLIYNYLVKRTAALRLA
jgi:hypothetical protein